MQTELKGTPAKQWEKMGPVVFKFLINGYQQLKDRHELTHKCMEALETSLELAYIKEFFEGSEMEN